MKNVKLLLLPIACLLIFLFAVTAGPICNYVLSPAYVKDYYGDSYQELLRPTPLAGYIAGKQVISQADKAFSSFLDRESAEACFGMLGRYCIHSDSYPEAIRQTHNLRMLAAHTNHDSGYVWVRYTSKAYDREGIMVTGSSNVYSRWTLERQDGIWVVTSIQEHP
ncbi:MAG: hypothetical protein IKU11_08590 [Clostridia bacterium]|nr:hypothetical protein [Clostridia bacterium]